MLGSSCSNKTGVVEVEEEKRQRGPGGEREERRASW